MIQPNEQRQMTIYTTKETPLLKNPSKTSLMERIKNAVMRREELKEEASLIKNDYGTFPLG